jgi:NitT/TauT family transport system ATP-binding protein
MGGCLDVNGVGKAFGDFVDAGEEAAHVVLQDISLTVDGGEFVCLLGPSGCGKSTLLSIIAGFESPTTGEVRLDGERITGPGSDRVMFFQDANAALFPWMTAEENAGFGLRMQGINGRQLRELVDRHLAMVGLSEHRKKFPAQLSGGMRQRIQIARGLAINPRIMLMDEPFGALDALTRRRMHRELLDIWENTRKTIIFVTHDIGESITLADRVAVMSRQPAATFRDVIPVLLARPRDPTDPEFGRLFRTIEALLHEDDRTDA